MSTFIHISGYEFCVCITALCSYACACFFPWACSLCILFGGFLCVCVWVCVCVYRCLCFLVRNSSVNKDSLWWCICECVCVFLSVFDVFFYSCMPTCGCMCVSKCLYFSLYVYVIMFVFVWVCLLSWVCDCERMPVCLSVPFMFVCTFVCVSEPMSVCLRIPFMFLHALVCVCVCVTVCICVRMRIQLCISFVFVCVHLSLHGFASPFYACAYWFVSFVCVCALACVCASACESARACVRAHATYRRLYWFCYSTLNFLSSQFDIPEHI